MLVVLSVPSLSSLSVEGRQCGEKNDEAYHDELMMPLMSILLDHSSDRWMVLDEAGGAQSC